MTSPRKPVPEPVDDVEFLNPRYEGATPEMVAKALLRHKPKTDQDGGEGEGKKQDGEQS